MANYVASSFVSETKAPAELNPKKHNSHSFFCKQGLMNMAPLFCAM